MRNVRVDARSSKDINERISRIHKELSYRGGKIELSAVRELLKLDLRYYRTDDPDLLDDVVHKLKVGAKQVLARPKLLLEAIKKFDLSALFVPDRKRILIDSEVPELKKRWCEAHEIVHSLIPWHGDYMLGDNRATLSQACHQAIESEANYGAGRLLFPHDTFLEVVNSQSVNLETIRNVAKHFGNTITSTLWRYVENASDTLFATIGEHPHHRSDEKTEIEYFVRSAPFEQQFPEVTEHDVWTWVKGYCRYNKVGPLGGAEVLIVDANGTGYEFSLESFSTKYNVLTLGKLIRRRPVIVAT